MIVYIILTLVVTLLGSMSGVGGGVLLKPAMDAIGEYDALTINAMVTATVFSMACISLVRNIIVKIKTKKAMTGNLITPPIYHLTKNETNIVKANSQSKKESADINFLKAAALGLGALFGAIIGEILLELLAHSVSDSTVKLTQNILSGLLALIAILYTNWKNAKTLNLEHHIIFFATGLFLGTSSIFCRAPINVPVLIFIFGMDIKKTTIYSLVAVLFAQGMALVTIAFTTGFAVYDLQILPFMITAAILGATSGILISMKISSKVIRLTLNILQGLVFCIVVYNIIIFSII